MLRLKHHGKFILFAAGMVLSLFAGMLCKPARSFALSADLDYDLSDIISEKEIAGTVYLCDFFDVKASAGYGAETIKRVFSGQLVSIKGLSEDECKNEWFETTFYCGPVEYRGFIPREFVAVSDEDFLAWEERKNAQSLENPLMSGPALFAMGPVLYGEETDPEESKDPYPEDIMQFPESYRESLYALKLAHPTWTFARQYTGIDFQTAVDNEMKGNKSLISKSFAACNREALYDGGNWYYPTEEILKHYMDPRNFLTETHIFMFEQLTYNETYHTQEAVEAFLANTFMNNNNLVPETVMTFGKVIYYIAKEEGREISPFFLASRILQEQGSGNSALISGTYPGYEGYYNYFNIGASGTTNKQVIENGLQYAKNHWDRGGYYSILYGADFISDAYVKKGQDTLYLQKYNVSPSAYYANYTHQYMQNISAPASEGYSTMNMYKGANSLDCAFVFKIPVYENMPEIPCGKPVETTKFFFYLPDGALENGVSETPSVWIDGVEQKSVKRNGYLVVDTENKSSTNAVIYKYDSGGVCEGMYVWMLDYSGGAYTVTYESGLEDILSYEGFSIRIKGESGIRFVSGINTDLKSALISSGVDEYKLSEYGTLVMYNENTGSYPLVKGGAKTSFGKAYGNSDSGPIDKVFDTVNGRAQFTSVLVGLPVSEYKTEFAFRGYTILKKGDKEAVIYGPIVSRSIYSLAQRILSKHSYEEGSSADTYLKKLVSDADALEGDS